MGVSREDVTKACERAVDAMIAPVNLFAASEEVRRAMRTTSDYFVEVINPVRNTELPFVIAVLDATLSRLKQIDGEATEMADDMREAFGLVAGSTGSEQNACRGDASYGEE